MVRPGWLTPATKSLPIVGLHVAEGRMLKNEESFDVEYWLRRLRQVTERREDGGSQEDLFEG